MTEPIGWDPAFNVFWRGGQVEDPIRLLALSMIRQAVRDAYQVGYVPKKDVASARAFLASDLFLELCVALGVPVSLGRSLQEQVVGMGE